MTNYVAVDESPNEKQGGFLDLIERVGNKVPTPAIMFVYLIAGLMGFHTKEYFKADAQAAQAPKVVF